MTPILRPGRLPALAIAGAFVAVALFLFAGSAAAAATTLYAVPGGDSHDPNCATPAANCSIQDALNETSNGDDVVVMPGTYDLDGGPDLNPHNNADRQITIHGEDGQPRPVIRTMGTTFVLNGSNLDGTVVRHLQLEQMGTQDVLSVSSVSSPSVFPRFEDDILIAHGDGRAAFSVPGGSSLFLSDSVAWAPGANGIAVLMQGKAADLFDDTVFAGGAGGAALDANPSCSGTCTADSDTGVVNSILRGDPASSSNDVEAFPGTDGMGHTFHASVALEFSNYAGVFQCAGCTVAQDPSDQSTPPSLVNPAAGDFHEHVGSPTRDAGHDIHLTPSSDPDGNPRVLGPAPDIGAYEYNGRPVVATLAATGVSTGAAQLNGSVDARGFATTFSFQYGTSTAYGNQTPVGSAGSGEGAGPVSAPVAGLPPGTLIHYRVVASNAYGGTAFGGDQTFTAPAVASSPAQPFASLPGSVKALGDGSGVTDSVACNPNAACVIQETLTTTEALKGKRVVSVARKHPKTHRKTVVVGQVTVTISAGQTQTVTVKLNGLGRKLEKKFKRLPVTLTVVLISPSGFKTVLKTAHLTLKPGKKHKAHKKKR